MRLYSFIHSFIYFFIHSLIHSFIHLFIYLFINSFIHSFIYLKGRIVSLLALLKRRENKIREKNLVNAVYY